MIEFEFDEEKSLANLVKNWFGDQYSKLHLLLQKLHTEGGRFTSDVEIHYRKGLAGIIGDWLAKKVNLLIWYGFVMEMSGMLILILKKAAGGVIA